MFVTIPYAFIQMDFDHVKDPNLYPPMTQTGVWYRRDRSGNPRIISSQTISSITMYRLTKM
jgi:hypothetical protein